ncbi:formate hydrogenlyase subunit 2 [Klebsiella pneumoniae]|uniref:Formate hydrogenlyase subunit 2 n=24 Tax=Enterobacterales TaxID=91347 RepID=A0A378BUI1_KLEPN|nr:formate hydrogenlyase subunit 2 [Klebsiella pneumoniae]
MNRFVIADSTVCIGCRTCEAACSETHRQHGLQAMPRLQVMRNEKESAPQMCHHCEDAPCATVCPVNAIQRVDGAVQLNESLCVSCKLCGIACPFGAIEFSGSRPLDIPANANTRLAPPAPPAPARVSSLLDWVPGVRAIAVKCDLCHFDDQGPACVRTCPTNALMLVDSRDIAQASKRKRQLTFNTDLGDLSLFQAQQGRGNECNWISESGGGVVCRQRRTGLSVCHAQTAQRRHCRDRRRGGQRHAGGRRRRRAADAGADPRRHAAVSPPDDTGRGRQRAVAAGHRPVGAAGVIVQY